MQRLINAHSGFLMIRRDGKVAVKGGEKQYTLVRHVSLTRYLSTFANGFLTPRVSQHQRG